MNKVKNIAITTLVFSSLVAVSANASAAQVGDTASERYGVHLNLTPSHMTAEEYQKYFGSKTDSTNVVTTKQNEVPTFENTEVKKITIPYYYNSSTLSGRYGIYTDDEKKDIIVTQYKTSTGSFVDRGYVGNEGSYSTNNEGKKVYNFRENGMQLKEESTNFANKTFLGEIKNSDGAIYRYWR